MKVLTLNFLTCAVKSCKSTSTSFPLHPKDCELVSDTIEPNAQLLLNVLPRLDWNALITTAGEVCHVFSSQAHSAPTVLALQTFTPEKKRRNILTSPKLGFPTLPPSPPTKEELESNEKMMTELHTLLLETQISEGSLVCGNCNHEYKIKEGIANFLLPNHLV